jgi:hypothetical protein
LPERDCLGRGKQGDHVCEHWDVGCGLGVVVVRRSEEVWEMLLSSGRKKVPKGVKSLMSGKRPGDNMTLVIIRTVGGHQ